MGPVFYHFFLVRLHFTHKLLFSIILFASALVKTDFLFCLLHTTDLPFSVLNHFIIKRFPEFFSVSFIHFISESLSHSLFSVVRYSMLWKFIKYNQKTKFTEIFLLTFPILCIYANLCIYVKIKTNLIFFHTSLWCLKMFYEGLAGLHKTF